MIAPMKRRAIEVSLGFAEQPLTARSDNDLAPDFEQAL
jgi:hypothetical protein